jgi:hypothetical protein
MDVDVGRPEAAFACGIEGQFEEDFASVPFPADERIRMQADVGERRLYSEAAHDEHDIGAEMDAGPDARKRRSLLINFDPESGALQQSGGGHAAKTRTDNGYALRTLQDMPFDVDYVSATAALVRIRLRWRKRCKVCAAEDGVVVIRSSKRFPTSAHLHMFLA